ncbi:MAG: Gfo/Idh/MocA family oxidoreductase [Alphaproteobacteria bacterium]|nr:Gfo/Idh/MocA family oxidoreductase [Alphaproteobacteria bacterium]MBU2191629.1 Gfo/Idh/MocA family oxidoreductase [Alphaproteobacteria bacterium]
MAERRFRVGIVGLQPGRSWAARAHVPALRSLPDEFEIAGVANTTQKSAEAAAAATGVQRAFADVAELVASPEVDIVAITVKVPHHVELVKAAIEAGKHVYCEWPLGNGLAEAQEMAGLANAKGVLGVVGTQARMAPEIEYLRKLISEGYVGEVLSTTLTARAGGWGAAIDKQATGAYLLDRANGATMLTIPLGHTLAALRDVLGDVVELSALLANRRSSVIALDTGQTLPMNAPDQVLVSAVLSSGAPLSIHYRGGAARGPIGLIWEINGTEGDIRVTGPSGHAQMVQLLLEGGQGDDSEMKRLQVPASYRMDWPDDPIIGNVARMYARMADDLRDGSHTAPSFDDAVELHRFIDVVETAAEEGQRVSLQLF